MCMCEATSVVPTLWDPIDCSLPHSSVHGILKARTLEWVAIPFSRGSSHPRDRTQVSCIVGRLRIDLTEAEEINNRWQEYTKELYKKGFNDPDNHNDVNHSPRTSHPGVCSQVVVSKHHYKQS